MVRMAGGTSRSGYTMPKGELEFDARQWILRWPDTPQPYKEGTSGVKLKNVSSICMPDGTELIGTKGGLSLIHI